MRLRGICRVRSKGREYFYAWRGGPRLCGDPAKDQEAAAEYFRILEGLKAPPGGSLFAALVERFRRSAEHRSRVPKWRNECERVQAVLIDEFGEADVAIFEDPRTRRDIKALRDRLAGTPRQADKVIAELRAILSWAEDNGEIGPHVGRRVGKLAQSDRSEIVWEAAEIEAVCAHLSTGAKAAVFLAAYTGLDMGDLVALPWSAVGPHDIQVRRKKTGKQAIIPILPETRAVLSSLERRGPVVLTTERKTAFTVDGLDTVFQRAKAKAGIEGKRFKDLRGTAATGFVRRGLSYAETGAIMGWSERDVERIARRYVSRDAIALAAVARLAKNGK